MFLDLLAKFKKLFRSDPNKQKKNGNRGWAMDRFQLERQRTKSKREKKENARYKGPKGEIY